MIFTFDLDGTVTRHPQIFYTLGLALQAMRHEVYILTGIPISVFNTRRKEKYPVLSLPNWYSRVITSDDYNEREKSLALQVVNGSMNNHELVGIYKRRVCQELNVLVHFDDDTQNVARAGCVPVLGVMN